MIPFLTKIIKYVVRAQSTSNYYPMARLPLGLFTAPELVVSDMMVLVTKEFRAEQFQVYKCSFF